MTITHPGQRLANVDVPETLLSDLAAHAHDLDAGNHTTREIITETAAAGLVDLGVSPNRTTLLEQAGVIETLAEKSLSAAFSLWCHRMCLEYLTMADGNYAKQLLKDLRAGTQVGSSAMASGFQFAAGLGDLSLRIESDSRGQLRLSGQLVWASNLFDDAVVFAAAKGPSPTSAPAVVAFPVSADGVEIGSELDLLALRGTASTSVTLNAVPIAENQVLIDDFAAFIGRARPVLSVLQASFCLGLASESYRHITRKLSGVRKVYEPELDSLAHRLVQVKKTFAESVPKIGTSQPPAAAHVLAARLEAGVLAKELTRLEAVAAGSQGFIATTDVNRRYREGTFIPIQAPSEAQLRWELAQASERL
jgi:alkylation response protein AidB-like acyl-CoA dehydrogenase